MARMGCREAAGTCVGEGYRCLCRRGHGRSAPIRGAAHRSYRRSADGRHECRRGPLWFREDVPAAGGKVSPRHEEGGRSSRSEEHTSELQSLMRISYAVFCLKKKIYNDKTYVTR